MRVRLKEAEGYASRGEYDTFFLILDRILSEYLEAKCGFSVVGSGIEDVEAALYSLGLSGVVVKGIKKGIELGRLVRFGKGKVDDEVVQEIMLAYAALFESPKEADYGESGASGDTGEDRKGV